jgi:Fe-S-cluster containining protein
MTNHDYEVAMRIALKNRSDIIEQIPSNLANREERLVETISKASDTPLGRLERLYVFMDELYSFVAKYTPCKKGCSHCCYYEASIPAIEAEYIEKCLGIKRNLYPSPKVSTYFGTACPFLKDNSCVVYEYRPFVCRGHVALFDNTKWCGLDVSSSYIFPRINFAEVNRCHSLIVSDSGSDQLYDIRQLFTVVQETSCRGVGGVPQIPLPSQEWGPEG